MRYLTYRSGNELRLGSLQEGLIVDVGQVAGISRLFFLIEGGPDVWKDVAAQLLAADLEEAKAKGWAIPYREALLTAPIARPPKNVICLGRNYYKHFLEGSISRGDSDKPPEAPIYFTKPHTSVNGPFDPIPHDPEITKQLDWEAELGVIIGIGGKKIKPEDALNHVFGYTVLNDVTARDLQNRHQQWFKGKGLDYSCPMGPVVVTPDELPNPVHLPISLKVNGVIKQEANTGQLMFDIPTIIADLSLTMTLEPGDVISTGTPEGVGHFRKPPEYLTAGAVMETIIEGIGTLRNRITDQEGVDTVALYNRELEALLGVWHHIEPSHLDLVPPSNPGWKVSEILIHLTAATASMPGVLEKHYTRTYVPGLEALAERNQNGIEQRRDQSLASLRDELIESHYRNIDFYLSLDEEKLAVEHTNAAGVIMNTRERWRRAINHYREHGSQVAEAIGIKMM